MKKQRMNEANIVAGVVAVIQDILKDIHTCMPGRVESVASNGKEADIKPLLKNPYTKKEYPTISGVPVLMNKNTNLYVDLSKGDLVLLIFSERSLDKWTTNGRSADTMIERHFDLSDPFAIPLVFSSSTAMTSLDGVVTGKCIDPFTGNVHQDKSSKVYARK